MLEWLNFILQVIEVVIWPITVLIILLTFKRQISNWLSTVKKAEFPGGLKFEIGELKESVEKSSEITDRSIHESIVSQSDELLRTGDPLLAVANTRLEIERQVVKLAQPKLSDFFDSFCKKEGLSY